MKKRICLIMLCLLFSISGCSGRYSQVETDEDIRIPEDEDALGEAAAIYDGNSPEDQIEGELVTSEDGTYQVMIPSGWSITENKIDASMLFELQGPSEDQYMGILILDEESYGVLDVTMFLELYAQNASDQYRDASVGEVASQMIDQTPAYMLRISGVLEEKNYVNLVYAKEIEQGIVIFSVGSYEENESDMTVAASVVVSSFE